MSQMVNSREKSSRLHAQSQPLQDFSAADSRWCPLAAYSKVDLRHVTREALRKKQADGRKAYLKNPRELGMMINTRDEPPVSIDNIFPFEHLFVSFFDILTESCTE